MQKAGIPIIPGSMGATGDLTPGKVMELATEIGFPVLIKAAGGGGGKGMRVVRKKDELADALKQASSEAGSSFGNPTVFIEKYLENPRHIEFQVLADNHGNVIHLGERECSVQRRYQKLVEEAPSPLMTPELREKMGTIAVKTVKATGYTNAGTVEFMVDRKRNFYFLEMNTRLQVEHPVTELVTGIDIVKEQLKIANGEKLQITQEDVIISGAAIECRISAEDPDSDFMPSTGKIVALTEPGGPGVRIDGGVFSGFEVPIYYDPLVAKLLVWAPTREEAISRMRRALSEYKIVGIKTGIPFHQLVMRHPDFVSGNYDTGFVGKLSNRAKAKKKNQAVAAIASTILKHLGTGVKVKAAPEGKRCDPWKVAGRQAGLRRM
jgi:acetyl-CoA carboxylase biotin carboxylase subunit